MEEHLKLRGMRAHAVSLNFNTFIVFLITNVICAGCLRAGWWSVVAIHLFVFESTFVEWRKKESRTVYYTLNVIIMMLGLYNMNPSVTMLVLMWDQNKMKKCGKLFDFWFERIYGHINATALPMIAPAIGVNSYGMFDGLIKDWEEKKETLRIILNSERACVLTRLRPEGISEVPISLEDRANIPAEEIHQRYQRMDTQMKMLYAIGALIIMVMLIGPMAILGMVGFLFMNENEVDTTPVTNKMEKGIIFQDGIYRIRNHTMGWETSMGIAVVHDGVLHTPYHVTNAGPVLYGKTRVYPYYYNIDQDIVTYGGPSKVTSYANGDQVYVNCETEESRTSYAVNIDVEKMNNVITWQGVTKPGESGSPVYALRDEKLQLLGLAGRYIKDEGCVAEYSNVKPVEEIDDGIEQITLHPGAGKTWKVIPDLVRKNLIGLNGKRIMVAGPTRVVCKELYQSLRKEGLPVGLNIKDTPLLRSEHAPIQVAAHRTALKMLVNRLKCVTNLGMLIIDEAHMDDTATILLRKFGRSAAARGVKIVELSATLDGKNNDASNYSIKDVEIMPTQVEEIIREHLENEKRIMVFVPSLKNSMARRLIKTFHKNEPILLSRDTYNTAIKDIGDETRKLIITTEIAECGINVKELEVVIDLGTKYTYLYEGGVIIGKTVGTTVASRTQRRGRVGRTRAGIYYEVKTPKEEYESAASFDAELLASGRNWTTGKSQWDITLSDQQFKVWLDGDMTPLNVCMDYNALGLRRDAASKRKFFTGVRNGKIYYIGCKENGCDRCAGFYKYYDERLHDRFLYGHSNMFGDPIN